MVLYKLRTPTSPKELARLRALETFSACFTGDGEGRYAKVDGLILPVLFQEDILNGRYEEDVQDPEDFPREWVCQFTRDINHLKRVILVKYESASNWPFVGIYEAKDAHGGNFLTCLIGKKVAKLYPR